MLATGKQKMQSAAGLTRRQHAAHAAGHQVVQRFALVSGQVKGTVEGEVQAWGGA